jgi:hypothetical protein
MRSSAILPSDPVTSARKFTASARESRATCQVAAGMPRPSSSHSARWTSNPFSPSEASELPDQDARLQLLKARGVAVEH